MRTRKGVLRVIAVMAAVVLLATACGDDGGTTDTGSGSNDSGSNDDGSNDDGSDDTGSGVTPGGTVNCQEIQEAMDFAGIDPTEGSSSNSREDDFQQSRAALAALSAAAPEIADDVQDALEGMDALGAAYADFGWNADFSNDPAAALAFAQELLSAGVLTNLVGPMTAISQWIAESCTS